MNHNNESNIDNVANIISEIITIGTATNGKNQFIFCQIFQCQWFYSNSIQWDTEVKMEHKTGAVTLYGRESDSPSGPPTTRNPRTATCPRPPAASPIPDTSTLESHTILTSTQHEQIYRRLLAKILNTIGK